MSLRRQVLRGGVLLAVRQGLGTLIGVAGVLLLTRAIGPAQYGLYAGALGVLMYLYALSQWGVSVYLIRREEPPTETAYHQASSFLLLVGGIVSLAAILALPLLEAWVRIAGFREAALPLLLALPLMLLSQVPMAKLERDLQYQRVALIELGAQVTYYLVALPLAVRGFGVWAPIAGWWAQQTVALTLAHAAARYRPRLHWSRAQATEMLGYGFAFSASTWVWQLRMLVNPLVVGRYGGALAVGYVALAIRIVEVLSFVKTATWRLSIAALARIRDQHRRLAQSVVEGMKLQVLAIGPLLLAFALVGRPIIATCFGPRWRAVPDVFPYIALSYLANSLFNLHSSALYVLRRNWDVTRFHLAHVALFVGAALLLVPRFGIVGYGMAEVVALASYAVVHLLLVRQVGPVDGQIPLAWGLALGVGLFAPPDHWWALTGVLALALWPAARTELVVLSKTVREVLRVA